jgi:hypothetical protein
MWPQFLLQNFHFAANLFASLAFFSIFWLYFDAWIGRKTFKEGLKILGFFFLTLSFLSHAILIESSTITIAAMGGGIAERLTVIFRNIGYLFLIIGLVSDPLIAKPKLAAVAYINLAVPFIIAPILAVVSAWLYLRRATVGLENHTRKVSLAFFFFSIHELLTISSLLTSSPNVNIFRLVAPFGAFWLASHIALLIGASTLIQWAFSYLLKRINTQLFIIFTTTTLSIFLLTTVSFTFLLLKNIEEETLVRLQTDVSVLSFALDAKKQEAQASASILAQNSEVALAINSKDRKTVATEAEALLLSRRLNSVVIIDDAGQVLARGEERDRIGDSLSDNPLVKRSLIGESISSITTQESAIAPLVLVKSAVPIISADGKVIGAVIVAISLDNSFLDGIKNITGLEVAVYGGEILSATSISDLHGATRPIGIRNSNKDISNIVLTKGKDFSGVISLLNTSYFAVYHPLKDVNNEVVGMLLAGRPAASIFAAAGHSIELTFLTTVILIGISIFPSFFIAKYITNQLT